MIFQYIIYIYIVYIYICLDTSHLAIDVFSRRSEVCWLNFNVGGHHQSWYQVKDGDERHRDVLLGVVTVSEW